MNNIEQNPVLELLDYYRNIYKHEDPSSEIFRVEGEVPKSIKKKIQIEYGPEPFYGYFDDDMTEDALLLLINPGSVDEVKNVCNVKEFNQFHKDRYLNWTKDEYLQEKELLKKIHTSGSKWRDIRRNQINNIVCDDGLQQEVPFMHTMEFFPYHSKKFNYASKTNMDWMCKLKTSNLLIKAIKYMAEQRKVKYILGIGIPWVKIFEKYGFEPIDKREYINPDTGKYNFRLYKYKFTEDSVPVIISVLGSGQISLPKDEKVVEDIRKMLV